VSEISPGVERVTESNRNNFSGFEGVTESNPNNFSGVERGKKPKSIPHELLELFNSSVYRLGDVHESQRQEPISLIPSQLGELIEQVVENFLGVTFSSRFFARYSPPQSENIRFRLEADGQLSLLDFEIESVDEQPDPDDFESLDAFREAIACWDWEHNFVSSEHNELLQVSLESFCLWVPCPPDWYEPAALLEPSSMLELSQTCKSSITSDFFIPIFDRLSDRPNRSDELPDTGISAKLPKPNSPRFPPATVGQVQLNRNSTAAQTQSKPIPNAYQTHTCCILAGSSIQPARSPPRSLACLLCL